MTDISVTIKNGESRSFPQGTLVADALRELVSNKQRKQIVAVLSNGNAVDLSSVPLTGTITPVVFIDGDAKKVSGMTFDDQDTFYVAERREKKIFSFDANGKNKTRVGKHKLDDDPEFIMWVPDHPYQGDESAADANTPSPCSRICTVL